MRIKTIPTTTAPKRVSSELYPIGVETAKKVETFYLLWNTGGMRANIPYGIKNKKPYESVWRKYHWKLVDLINRNCEGGEEFVSDLLEADFFVADAHWTRRRSKQGINSFEAQVCLTISNDYREERIEMEEASWQGLLRLMSQTWLSCHIYNYPEFRDSEVVMSFNSPVQEDPQVAIVL